MKNVKLSDESHQLLRIAAAMQGVAVSALATEAVLSYCRSIVGDTAKQLGRKRPRKMKRQGERRRP